MRVGCCELTFLLNEEDLKKLLSLYPEYSTVQMFKEYCVSEDGDEIDICQDLKLEVIKLFDERFYFICKEVIANGSVVNFMFCD